MSKRDPRVDAYIAKANEFARPILSHLRKIVHKGCPEVTETIKWSAPFFMRKSILCNMAAFNEHCSFGFWKNGEAIVGKQQMDNVEGMGQFGRITSLKDLPPEKVLIAYVRKAVELDEAGIKPKTATPKPRAPLPTPDDLAAALKKNKKAAATFETFNPSQRRDYIEWIIEAKRPETRAKRLEQTVAWLSEGKARNWKYQNC